jgi:hypothetical protein
VFGDLRRPERQGHGRLREGKEPLLRGFLQLPNGVPSHDTFSRLFRFLDPNKFGAAFSQQCRGVTAIDGKVLRRSYDRASGKPALQHGQRLGVRVAHGARPDRHGCEVERDHGGAEIAGDAVAEGHHRHR